MTLPSVNAVRHYHKLGLLPPAGLDVRCRFTGPQLASAVVTTPEKGTVDVLR